MATLGQGATGGETYTLIVVGEGGVGKSALTMRLVEGTFDSTYNPTVEDSFTKATKVDDIDVTLKILDTAGQEEYIPLREAHFSRADGFILVYSIVDRLSFDAIPKLRTAVLTHLGQTEFPMIVVGNKKDLEATRKVTTREGQDLARSYQVPFLEASALQAVNVESLFFELVRLIRKSPSVRNKTGSPSDRPTGKRKWRCTIC